MSHRTTVRPARNVRCWLNFLTLIIYRIKVGKDRLKWVHAEYFSKQKIKQEIDQNLKSLENEN